MHCSLAPFVPVGASLSWTAFCPSVSLLEASLCVLIARDPKQAESDGDVGGRSGFEAGRTLFSVNEKFGQPFRAFSWAKIPHQTKMAYVRQYSASPRETVLWFAAIPLLYVYAYLPATVNDQADSGDSLPERLPPKRSDLQKVQGRGNLGFSCLCRMTGKQTEKWHFAEL